MGLQGFNASNVAYLLFIIPVNCHILFVFFLYFVIDCIEGCCGCVCNCVLEHLIGFLGQNMDEHYQVF